MPNKTIQILVGCLIIWLAGCKPMKNTAQGVRLMLDSDIIQPNTTFELRFDQHATEDNLIGVPLDSSPLVMDPPLKGKYVWLSRSSGVFTPTEPPRLQTSYTLKWDTTYKGSESKTIDVKLHWQVKTPPFQVTAWGPAFADTNNIPARPSILVQFNAGVPAASSLAHAEFRDRSGQTCPVKAQQATVRDFSPGLTEGVGYESTWNDQFYSHATRALRESQLPASPLAKPGTIAHRLVMTPLHPLPPGKEWKLVLKRGLSSSENGLKLRKSTEIFLGNVTLFSVKDIQLNNSLNSGKSIQVVVSKPLSVTLNSTNIREWITIEPVPNNLQWRLEPQSVILAGAYELNRSYTLSIKNGLPSQDGFTLLRAFEQEFEFKPMTPKILLPSFAAEQVGEGNRTFELLSINLPEVHLRARLLDRHTLVHGLRGYQSYYKQNPTWDDPHPYLPIDFNLVPGRVIYQTNLPINVVVDQAHKVNLSWDEILGGRRYGVVFLSAERLGQNTNQTVGSQTLVQLTDIGLVWKANRQQLWAFAFSYASGLPLAGVKLFLATQDNEVLHEAVTDSQGVALLPKHNHGQWLVAESGDDLRAINLTERWSQQLPIYGFNIDHDWSEEDPDRWKLMLFSDRPVYRPGETLYLKGIARVPGDGIFTIPQKAQALVRCFDSRDSVFFVTNTSLSSAGSFSLAFPVPLFNRGSCRAEVVLTNLSSHKQELETSHFFRVEDFQPNAFEVKITPPQSTLVSDPLSVSIQAQYLNGQPVSRAQVRWSLDYADPVFAPEGFEGFWFTDNAYLSDNENQSAVMSLHGEVPYTAEAPCRIVPALVVNTNNPQPRTIAFYVEMTDLNQQTISENAQWTLHTSEYYLGLKRIGGIIKAGESVPLSYVAVTHDGKPYTQQVPFKLRIFRIDWHSVRQQGAGGTIQYRNQAELTRISEQDMTTQILVQRGKSWDIVDNNNQVVFVAEQSGAYLLEASAQDAKGHPILTRVTLHVAGKNEIAWDYLNAGQIHLVADQADYQPGQAAKLLLKTPIDGSALVTIEREKVTRSFIVPVRGRAPVIEVPIRNEDAPGVYVSVLLLRGLNDSPRKIKSPEYRLGYVYLPVTRPESRLLVTVKTPEPEYRPGQNVPISVEVRDFHQIPVTNAEVCLYAVDEGILNLMGYAAPDPNAYFYAARPLGIWSYSTFPTLLPEDPAFLRFSNKGYVVGGGGDGSGSLRKNFLPCAFWKASLATDSSGTITTSFVAPDSLTRYRIFAVVTAKSDMMGCSQTSVTLNKPLMLEPSLPRFSHEGDIIMARVVVHNRNKAAARIEVSLLLDEHASLESQDTNRSPKQNAATNIRSTNLVVEVSAQSAGMVNLPVRALSPGQSTWVWNARFVGGAADSPSDSVQSKLAIESAKPRLRETHLASAQTGKINLLSPINPQFYEARTEGKVRISFSRLSQMGMTVNELLHYPYGCIEQTCSSLLPWLAISGLEPMLPDLTRTPDEVKQVVQRGIHRIIDQQVYSGGLAYWPGGRDTELWLAAYGAFVLSHAKDRGFALPSEPWKRLLGFLSLGLRESSRLVSEDDLGARCLALYALARAGKSEPAYHELMFEKRNQLSLESRALLALAIIESKGPISQIQTLLEKPNQSPPASTRWFGCKARELALQLMAWSRFEPRRLENSRLLEELISLSQEGHWRTTQGNAWALLALADYTRLVEKLEHPIPASIAWQGQTNTFTLSANFPVFELTINWEPVSKSAALILIHTNASPLHSVVSLECQSALVSPPRQNRGLTLDRTYQVIGDDGKLHETKSLKVGDRVLLTLRLQLSQPAHYLAIEDPWPAVFEGVNLNFSSHQIKGAGQWVSDWASDYREFRQDRALFFCNHLAPGTYSFQYLARVRAAGTALAPAAKVEEMYHPERFALTETLKVVVPMDDN